MKKALTLIVLFAAALSAIAQQVAGTGQQGPLGSVIGYYGAGNDWLYVPVDSNGYLMVDCATGCASGNGTVNSGAAFAPAYYPALGTAVSGATPFNGVQYDSTTGPPSAASSGQLQTVIGTGVYDPSGAAATAQGASLQKANNLSDLANVSAAQNNITEPQVYFNKMICPGDSITFKYHTSNTVGSLCDWLGWHVGVPSSDRGITGYWAYQEDPVLMGFGDLPTSSKGVVAYTIGTNNYFNEGNSTVAAYQYGQNVLAQYAFLAVPSTQRTFASTWALTGTWVAAAASTNGRQTTTSGATATFTATGSTIYVGYQAVATTPGAASMTCDGTATGATFDIAASASGGTLLTTYQSQLVRVTGLTNTAHTCVITTSTTGIVGLLWAAGLSGANQSTWPVVLAGSIPTQNVTSGDFSGIYRAYQPTDVTTLNGDGLVNLIYVNNTTALTVGINFADALHPNDQGYYLLAQPYITALDTWLALPVPLFNLPYTGVGANTATYGVQNLGLGFGSLTALSITTPGTNDTCYGQSSCPVMTTGGSNTAVGANGLGADTTGGSNSAVGATAGSAISTGSNNTVMGAAAGSGINTGSNNTMFGTNTGRNQNSAADNSDFGEAAGINNTSGHDNTSVGFQAGQLQTTGSQNTAVGGNAGTASGVTILNNCTFLGYNAQATTTSLTNCAAYGFGAQVTASNTVVFGNNSVTDVYFGSATPSAALHANQYDGLVATVTASATPALVATNGLQTITLSANATPTITGIAAGQRITFQICEGATVYSWTWPTAVHGGMCIGSGCSTPSLANTCSMQSFDSFTGTTLVPESTGVVNIAP